MKAYVQYLDYSPVSGNLYEPCGDRAVVILDGRNSLETMIKGAHEANGFRRPKYPHFKIMFGNFRESREVYSTIKA
jgi:hypothetical protein